MQDPKFGGPGEDAADSSATSKETLEDLERNEVDADSEGTSGDAPSPAPDGAFAEADEDKETGPM
jgi:hypothetical protein